MSEKRRSILRSPYRVGFDEVWDRFGFFGYFAAGTAVILICARFGIPKLWSTMICASIMSAYFIQLVFDRRIRLEQEQSGDNIYYLGLLFTLVSLGVALFSFSVGATSNIIQSFAIVITTTILGIAMRVILNQARPSPDDFEDEARLQLGQSSLQLKSELASTIDRIETVREAAEQSIQRSQSDSTVAFQKALSDATKQFATTLDQISTKTRATDLEMARIAEATTELSEKLQSAADRASSVQQSLLDSTLEVANATKGLAATVGESMVRMEESQRAIADLAAKSASAAETIKTDTNIARESSALAAGSAKEIRAAATELEAAQQKAKEAMKWTARIDEEIGALQSRFAELHAKVSDTVRDGSISAQVRRVLRRWTK